MVNNTIKNISVGAIGNMTSMHAHITTLNKPVYNIVKFGLCGLTQSIDPRCSKK
jgi:short-subunit dehydrogenase